MITAPAREIMGRPEVVKPEGVLLTLLLTGRASDQAGRKPVLAAALG
jgi:hypothetical protein